jgi:hypothetical protein
MITIFENYDYTNFKMGDIIVPSNVKMTIDTIFVFYEYKNFYHVNRRFFNYLNKNQEYDNFTLEEFYEKYPDLTAEIFIKLHNSFKFQNSSASVKLIADRFLKRIPELNIYVQTNKFNL